MVGARARYGQPTRRYGDSKKIACKAYQKIIDWIGGRRPGEAGESPIRMGAGWFSANRSIPARKIEEAIWFLSPATLAKYWTEIQDTRGVHTSEKPRPPQRKNAEELETKRPVPDDGAMYDFLRMRICAVREAVRVATSETFFRGRRMIRAGRISTKAQTGISEDTTVARARLRGAAEAYRRRARGTAYISRRRTA